MSRRSRRETNEIKALIMATGQELLKAIETNGLAIATVHDAVNSVAPTILKALEDAKSGAATARQIDEAINMLTVNTESISKAKDAVLQLIPSVPSPEVPTPPGQVTPAPIPEPIPDISEVVIAPAPEVGLPGTVAIDFAV